MVSVNAIACCSSASKVETAESLEKLGIAPEDIKPVAPSAIETLQSDIPASELLKDIATPIVETKDEGKCGWLYLCSVNRIPLTHYSRELRSCVLALCRRELHLCVPTHVLWEDVNNS